jgi:hypothetical protein
MELIKIEDIINRKKTSDLYIVCPKVYSGKIIDNKVLKIRSVNDYYWGVIVEYSRGYSTIYRKESRHEEINPDTEINTQARVFTDEEEAANALKDSVRVLSYDAIKSVDKVLKRISEQKSKLKIKEDKYKALKKEYFEMSLSKFSK